MLKKKVAIVLTLFITAILIMACSPTDSSRPEPNSYQKKIVEYLNQKPYTADKVALTENDLKVDGELDKALAYAGVSVYTLLRNESFARHGYIFKDKVLQDIFSRTAWYKPSTDFQFNKLSKLETRNVEFIRSIETTYDYQNIAKELNSLDYGRSSIFLGADTNVFSHDAAMSLNHVRVNPSRLLRNYILARRGYIFKDPALREIFSRTDWYQPRYSNLAQVSAKMTKAEFVDVELLKKKEWMDILEAVNFTLPRNVISIPTVGYNALFIRELVHQNQSYFYSSQFIHALQEVDAGIFDDHRTDVDKLVSEEIVRRIKAEKDPAKKIVLYFDNKQYKGYTDSLVFNHSDMQVPSYLKDAVEAYGVDYRILLRKEIHARAGARFIDKKSGEIFSQCSWYKPRYDLTPRTVSRLPVDAAITRLELINFALLEGEELAAKAKQYKDKNMVVDLSGNVYFVKVGLVNIPGSQGRTMKMASDFASVDAYENGSLQDAVNEVFEKYQFNARDYQEQEQQYAAIGC